jgi:hypothetical protein
MRDEISTGNLAKLFDTTPAKKKRPQEVPEAASAP